MNTPRSSVARFACLLTGLACVSSTSVASLNYYTPFDNSFVNEGTVGGAATPSHTAPSSHAPTFINNVPSGLDSTHSLRTGSSSTRVTLPNSTGALRLDGAGQAATFSTWIYQDSTTRNWSDFAGNWVGGSTGSGWQASITNTGAVRFRFQTVTGPGTQISREIWTAANVIGLQTWANLTFSFNTDTGIDIYVNGVRQDFFTNSAGNVPTTISAFSAITNSQALTLNGGTAQVAFDDVAIWNSALTAGEAAALYKAPSAIAGYDAGKLDPLFALHRAAGSDVITEGSIAWTYVSGFDVAGRALGDVWSDGINQFMWLGGDAANATGLYTGSPVPEPASVAALAGLAAIGLTALRRKRR